MDRLFAHLHNSTWTLPGGLSAADDDDQRRLEEFLARHPAVYAAIVESIRKGTTVVQSHAAAQSPALDAVGEMAAHPTGSSAQVPLSSRSADTPKAPIPMSAGMSRFAIRRAEGKKKRNPRTTADQVALVKKFVKHHEASLGCDPWVHEFDTHHIGTFIDAEAKNTGKYLDEKGEPELVTASTLKKKLLDLGLFFSIMVEFQACLANPVAGLNKRREDLAATANEEHESYLPFTKDHIAKIFEPSLYLSHNRDPDYFWCGLLAAHQGGRLAEYVLATPSDVAQDQHGIWYLAARQLLGQAISQALQTHFGQQRFNTLPLAAIAVASAQVTPVEGHVLSDGEPGEEPRFLEHEADVAHRAAQRFATQTHLAVEVVFQPGHHPQQRALATAAGTHQGHQFAGSQFQADVLQHGATGVGLAPQFNAQ